MKGVVQIVLKPIKYRDWFFLCLKIKYIVKIERDSYVYS